MNCAFDFGSRCTGLLMVVLHVFSQPILYPDIHIQATTPVLTFYNRTNEAPASRTHAPFYGVDVSRFVPRADLRDRARAADHRRTDEFCVPLLPHPRTNGYNYSFWRDLRRGAVHAVPPHRRVCMRGH